MIEAAELVSHLAENLRAGKTPERPFATSRTFPTPRSLWIPVSCSLGEPFERRTLEVGKLGAIRSPPVPARNPKCTIDVSLIEREHINKGSRGFGRLRAAFAKEGGRFLPRHPAKAFVVT